MYFQIENTPEHIRKARRSTKVKKESPKEECPRLVLAPFSKPPQVVFDNILIGSTCERSLEVFNPLKQCQQLTLGKSLPPGLIIHLPEERLSVEPQTCYCLTMEWTPTQPMAIRETLRFTNDGIGRFDVIVVLKSVMNIKGKGKEVKGKSFKTSPGKIKKKVVAKKSPVAISKKKAEIIYNITTKFQKSVNVAQSSQYQTHPYQTSNKENIAMMNDYSINSYRENNKCPFDSPTSLDMHFNTSEIFPNARKTNILQDTYDMPYDITNDKLDVPHNVLKPLNRQQKDNAATDIFDNLTFTPLKPSKTDKLEKGPKIVLSLNSESEFDDSLEMKNANKENETHSVIVTSTQPPNQWLTVDHHQQIDQCYVTPHLQTKKHPNTSSPKEFNSPNFSINTDFSRISELSFLPQRFSTERKCFPKINDTNEIPDEVKLNSDTYTKDSPYAPMEYKMYQMNIEGPPHYFMKEQPKMCRQSLFREYQLQKEANEKNYLNVWQGEERFDRSPPPRSITPPLQSIPEESIQFSETQTLDKTDKQMTTFTINRTFDRSISQAKQTWSKKSVKAEPELWKIPVTQPKKSLNPKQKNRNSIASKVTNNTFDMNKSSNQNITLNQYGNVYSQSSTIDPFLSSTYFYDEEAVEKFENEFKRWLNCILTPPADLESNIEQKIDVGKAWIENRNKEVPLAPTREQVSSMYHNSHRLESLRRAARSLLMSSEIAQVFLKLNAQIEKKLIVIRTDKNLHLDVGLQKIIMELILSYNPLWLRIGLEAIYGLVLPLKSNSDIEGLTTFIINRMFKNPFLKNKNSKSNAPNMLLPAYMEALKRFTLKKFFMLVFFLDQAKQRKLISHDPCLFCRNAICKESREIIIRFTRELIAGIGDITRHLRPLGYVVSHKQSYLDEYKYAVQNLALDIRDGVRLTKVMEIILMKNGLLNQLRTPAISRLQKIHNVQVAFNALKDANFVIVGDITAIDIADGHREKTLSLLWQLIHVFRAPLFEKAACIIQTWWKKKYEVIVEKRKEEEKIKENLNNAASKIQCWWRRIKYNRQVEWQMQIITRATIVVQKYCRMWLCRTRLRKLQCSVINIQRRYRSVVAMRLQRAQYLKLRQSVIIIQSRFRALLAMRKQRQSYLLLRSAVLTVQIRYRAKRQMKLERREYLAKYKACVTIQRFYRACAIATKLRQEFLNLKNSVINVQRRYRAILAMRRERQLYLQKREAAIYIQNMYRVKKLMLQQRQEYLNKLRACRIIQNAFRARRLGKQQRDQIMKMKSAVILIQTRYRMMIQTRVARSNYLLLKKSASKIQAWFRSVQKRNECRQRYLYTRRCIIIVQSVIRMYIHRQRFLKIQQATITIQTYYRFYKQGINERQYYLRVRRSIIKAQSHVRSFIFRRRYLKHRASILKIQAVFRLKRHRTLMNKRREEAAVCIQKHFRRYIIQKKYQDYRQKVVYIQKLWRGMLLTRLVRCEFMQKKRLVIKIQSVARGYLVRKMIQNKKEEILIKREEQKKHLAASRIQALFRGHKVRVAEQDKRVAELRRRWREDALIISNEQTLRERYEEALDVLRNYRDIETVIKAFRSLELLTEIFPMMFNSNASPVVRQVYVYMSATNRSISSIEVLKSAAAVLVNLTRYKITGPMIYARDRISTILKFMLRFSNSETHLFCIMCTYIWLFSKYDTIREDLTEFLHMNENHTFLKKIKDNVERMIRMANNARGKFYTPQSHKFKSHTGHTMNMTICSNSSNNSFTLPCLEPDYGIVRDHKPRYFKDPQQAINGLFHTFNL